MLRLPDPEPPATVQHQARRDVPVSTTGQRAGTRSGSARNPLFRAIDGGLADDGGEEAPRQRRGSARRARPAAAPRRRAAAERPSAHEAGEGGRLRPECYGCPVGIAFGTVREASPETLDHLFAASRELVSAARSVMEALEANLERHAGRGPVQHIDLD